MTKLVSLLLVAAVVVFSGCNTIAGAGQDISNGGHAITNGAEQNK